MKSQISRHSHDPDRRYSGVYQQQGRMLTDADWNELVDVLKASLRLALADVIGSGAPRDQALQLQKTGAGAPLQVRPGTVYVEGLRASWPGTVALDFTAQPDFAGATAPPPDARVYADVWERAVFSLEDAALVDPGLFGADTTSRSQTMLQLKWCPLTTNPGDATRNPPQGDATFGIAIPDDGDEGGASTTEGAAGVGNYLFRLEVHAVVLSNGQRELTLKWSSENGAEQQPLQLDAGTGQASNWGAQNLPASFVAGDWLYELFSADTDRHLGVHLQTGAAPALGAFWVVRNAQAPPSYKLADGAAPGLLGDGHPPAAVRRWDGYCRLALGAASPGVPGSATLIEGWDKGQVLAQAGQIQAHGDISFDVSSTRRTCSIRLQNLVLTLVLDAGFVAGDFWLGVVRETLDGAPGSAGSADDARVRVLGHGRPIGIRHHYLELGRLEGGLLEVAAEGSPDQRRRNFPTLSNLDAAHVGTPIPTPPASTRDSVRKRLPSTASLAHGADSHVRFLLDALLCELDAATLPYDRTAANPASVADLMVKKTGGDTVSGDLTVTGLLTAGQFKLPDANARDKWLLSYNAADGLAKWLETSLTAWNLRDGNLSTDSSVTGSITLGSPESEALFLSSDGKLGLGTASVVTNARAHIKGGALAVFQNNSSYTQANAAIHVSGTGGSFGRLLQMSPLGPSVDALNLLASMDANATPQWWSWGVNSQNAWRIRTGTDLAGGTGLTINASGTVLIDADAASLGLSLPLTGVQLGASSTVTDNFHLTSDMTGGSRGFRLWNGNHGAGTHLLTVTHDGKLGLGTADPQAPWHLVTETNPPGKVDLPDAGMKWSWGKHIADGVTRSYGIKDAYGRLITWDSDSMFVGLKSEGPNRKDAVIAWGDDDSGAFADSLRFIFTPNSGDPAQMRDVLKMSPQGAMSVAGTVEVGATMSGSGAPGALLAGGGTVGAFLGHNLIPGTEFTAAVPGPSAGIQARDGSLAFYATRWGMSDFTPTDARLFIDAEGRVGIGTTNPEQARLVVNGDLLVTGVIRQLGLPQEDEAAMETRLAQADIHGGDLTEGSLGGTTFRLLKDGSVNFTVALIGLGPSNASFNVEARLRKAGVVGHTQLFNNSGMQVTEGTLFVEQARDLTAGSYAVELWCTAAPVNPVALVFKSLAITVTHLEAAKPRPARPSGTVLNVPAL